MSNIGISLPSTNLINANLYLPILVSQNLAFALVKAILKLVLMCCSTLQVSTILAQKHSQSLKLVVPFGP